MLCRSTKIGSPAPSGSAARCRVTRLRREVESDIVRSAIRAQIDGAWAWEIMKGDDVEESGQGTSRRDAMGKAEVAVRKLLPTPTDVQVVTGWLALRSEVPDEVLAAALRLAERDRAERKDERSLKKPLGSG